MAYTEEGSTIFAATMLEEPSRVRSHAPQRTASGKPRDLKARRWPCRCGARGSSFKATFDPCLAP